MSTEDHDPRPSARDDSKERNGGKPEDRGHSKEGDAEKDTEGDRPKHSGSKKPLIILAGVVLVAAIVAFFVWFARRNQVTTDDAFTDGNAIMMAPKV
jgi:membrane fusion protein (multidrug efflux system)